MVLWPYFSSSHLSSILFYPPSIPQYHFLSSEVPAPDDPPYGSVVRKRCPYPMQMLLVLMLLLGLHNGIVTPCNRCARSSLDGIYKYGSDGESLKDACWHCSRERKTCVYPGKRASARGVRRRRIDKDGDSTSASTSRLRIEDDPDPDPDPVFLGEECRVVEIITDNGLVFELKYKMTVK